MDWFFSKSNICCHKKLVGTKWLCISFYFCTKTQTEEVCLSISVDGNFCSSGCIHFFDCSNKSKCKQRLVLYTVSTEDDNIRDFLLGISVCFPFSLYISPNILCSPATSLKRFFFLYISLNPMYSCGLLQRNYSAERWCDPRVLLLIAVRKLARLNSRTCVHLCCCSLLQNRKQAHWTSRSWRASVSCWVWVNWYWAWSRRKAHGISGESCFLETVVNVES